MKNFDRFVGVDWSGARSPVNTKSISLSVSFAGISAPIRIDHVRSRTAVAQWIESLLAEGGRTLIGIDCNFGYAQEIAAQQFGKNYSYRDVWREIDKVNESHPNYFAGNVWSQPPHQKYFWTEGKKPAGFNLPRRVTEAACGNAGYGWPESPFKMIGPKQVGKGGLAGMRLVHDLTRRYPSQIAVWPFQPYTESAQIVIAEIYPRLFIRQAAMGNAKIKSLAGVNAVLTHMDSDILTGQENLSDHDADSLISAAGLRFLCGNSPNIPDTLCAPVGMDDIAMKGEGWIFGV
jgi:hypothetical protein